MSTRRESFAVGDRANLVVSSRSGTVDVRVGDAGVVTVDVDAEDADQWNVAQLGDTIAVEPGPRRGWRVRSARMLIRVPSGVDVDINTASADINLNGSFGSIRAKTASGDVRADTASRLEIRTASGDAVASDVDHSADCSTASGDVALGHVGGRLNVSTASGDVRVTSAAHDVEIGSASGNVRIDRYEGSDVKVKCISGDVMLGLPSGIRVEPEISTLSGRTSLPEPSRAGSDRPRRVVRVGLRTVSGDISIRRV